MVRKFYDKSFLYLGIFNFSLKIVNSYKGFTRRTTHELTQLCCITHVSGSTTTQLCCITHPSGNYYHSIVLYNSPEWKVLPLSYVV